MEVTLEKIELVKERTGVSYKEAKEALEAADGSVVDAIIAIEESINTEYKEDDTMNEIIEKIKEVIEKGNMARIIIKKDDEVLINFPLTVSIVGAVLVPWGAILGAVAAAGFGCVFEFVTDKGEVVDINGKVIGVYDKGKKVFTGNETLETVKAKGAEAGAEIKEKAKTLSDSLKDKFEEWGYKEKAEELDLKAKVEEFDFMREWNNLKEQAGSWFKTDINLNESFDEAGIADVPADIEDVIVEAEAEEVEAEPVVEEVTE